MKSQLIIDELKKRLSLIPQKIKPELGYPGMKVDTYPSVWIIKGVQNDELIKPGLYQKELPLAIEYYKKGIKSTEIEVTASSMEEEIRKNVETDERFTDSITGKDLLIEFHSFRTEHLFYPSPLEVMCVSIGYTFGYVEEFLGFQGRGTSQI